MFTKEERLFIWKKVYEMIDRLEDGEYICVALRNVVFMYLKTHKNIYEFRSDEMVRIYFPELEEKISMATEPEETRKFYGWFGCISPETKEVRLNIVKDIIKEFGFKAGEAWSEITEYAYGCLSYSDFATTEMLIPEGSEHLFKDIYTAKADELYHHVLDKFGWAWRDPKYKSETELCAMLKWAKEKGLTIEELSI